MWMSFHMLVNCDISKVKYCVKDQSQQTKTKDRIKKSKIKLF